MRQIVVGAGHDVLNTSATEYIAVTSRRTNNWNSGQAVRRQVVPSPCEAMMFRVELSQAPGGGGTYTFNIRRSNVNTGIQVVITDPDTSGEDLVNTDAFGAGARINIQCVPSGGPTNTPRMRFSFVIEDDDERRQHMIFGHNNVMNRTLVELNYAYCGDVWSAAGAGTNGKRFFMPIAGSIEDFYCQLNGSPGTGNSYDLALQKNGLAALSVNISGASTTGNDTSSSNVSVGDNLRLQSTPNSNPTARYLFAGFILRPELAYYQAFFGATEDALPTAATEYNFVEGSDVNWTATETERRTLVDAMTISDFYASVTNAPTVGNSWTFTIMKNGAATSLAITIADTATNGNDLTDFVEFAPGDSWSMRIETSGGSLPANTECSWALLGRTNIIVQNSGMTMGMGI